MRLRASESQNAFRSGVSEWWRYERGDAIAILSAGLRDERRAGDRRGDGGQPRRTERCFDRAGCDPESGWRPAHRDGGVAEGRAEE